MTPPITESPQPTAALPPDSLPQPPTLPLTALPGFLLRARRDIVPALTTLFEVGSPVRLSAPGTRLVFVDRAADADRVLVGRQDVYVKGPEYDIPALGLRAGLVTSRGARWQRDRAMLNPLFAKRGVAPLIPLMRQRVLAQRQRWERYGDGDRVDVAHEMMQVTLDIAARTMFGVALNDTDSARLGVVVERILRDMLLVGNSPVTWGAQALPGMTLGRAARLHWRSVRIRHGLAEADEFMREVLRRRAADPSAPGDDFLARLLSARDELTGAPLPISEILEQSQTFLAAGHETTATGLTWMWHLLGANPQARQRLFDELDEVLDGCDPEVSDLDRLPWTRACFAEALRIHPPVYLSMRTATRDDELSGRFIPAGTIVVVLTHLLHRDPEIWPDPLRFDPARFLPGAGPARPRGAYLPFGGGRRVCIGAQFATAETTLLTAALAQRFRLDPLPGVRVREQGWTTLRPRGGLTMTLHRRAVRA
ncbi:cytochrome P450 [Nocardia sp. NBC_00511]|uniref:cytochrome P450 n=1 Tax=Nocardia sp. NBC_00511 TaxID=2903591 RepID=UPI0030E50E86